MDSLILPGRILGIFWTTAGWSSFANEGYGAIQLTNQNKELLEEVRNFFAHNGFNYKIYKGATEEKRPGYKYDYYRLKIYNHFLIEILRDHYNWRGRKEKKRYYPHIEFEKQELGFLKYYIKNKGSLDFREVDYRDSKVKRYRIFANWNYINYLNQRISKLLDVNENKPQKHKNSDVMMTLVYQGQKDIEKILEFINS